MSNAQENKPITDEEMLAAVRQAIFHLMTGFQSYTGPSGETYTRANLADLQRTEKQLESKIAFKKSGGVYTRQVNFG